MRRRTKSQAERIIRRNAEFFELSQHAHEMMVAGGIALDQLADALAFADIAADRGDGEWIALDEDVHVVVVILSADLIRVVTCFRP